MSGLRERVEALASGWERDIATLRADAVRDGDVEADWHAGARQQHLDALRAELTADEPTALAGYMVAPDGVHPDNLAIWRGGPDDLFPTIAITKRELDPALWDVLVAAVERTHNTTETP